MADRRAAGHLETGIQGYRVGLGPCDSCDLVIIGWPASRELPKSRFSDVRVDFETFPDCLSKWERARYNEK